jgi:uncharacterized membrane protein
MIFPIVPILMALGGGLLYVLAPAENPKAAQIGLYVMAAGLFAIAFANGVGKLLSF